MTSLPDILVIGGVSLDAIVHLAAEKAPPCSPHASVDRWYETVGGTGTGKALNLAALGFGTTLHAVIGDDRAGDEVTRRIEAGGVRLLTHVGREDTQRHTNLMSSDGGRLSIPVVPPANPVEFDPDALRSIMAGSEIVMANILDYVRPCLRTARELGKPLWVDLHDYDGEASHHEAFIEAADVVFVSSEKLPDPAAFARRMIDAGKRLVVCTMGAAGSCAWDASGARGSCPAVASVTVTDTNGAGDAYASGFLLAHAQGDDLDRCLAYGSAAAAWCIRSREMVHPAMTSEAVRSDALDLLRSRVD